MLGLGDEHKDPASGEGRSEHACSAARREARTLIEAARSRLIVSRDEMAVLYLDHAIAELSQNAQPDN